MATQFMEYCLSLPEHYLVDQGYPNKLLDPLQKALTCGTLLALHLAARGYPGGEIGREWDQRRYKADRRESLYNGGDSNEVGHKNDSNVGESPTAYDFAEFNDFMIAPMQEMDEDKNFLSNFQFKLPLLIFDVFLGFGNYMRFILRALMDCVFARMQQHLFEKNQNLFSDQNASEKSENTVVSPLMSTGNPVVGFFTREIHYIGFERSRWTINAGMQALMEYINPEYVQYQYLYDRNEHENLVIDLPNTTVSIPIGSLEKLVRYILDLTKAVEDEMNTNENMVALPSEVAEVLMQYEGELGIIKDLKNANLLEGLYRLVNMGNEEWSNAMKDKASDFKPSLERRNLMIDFTTCVRKDVSCGYVFDQMGGQSRGQPVDIPPKLWDISMHRIQGLKSEKKLHADWYQNLGFVGRVIGEIIGNENKNSSNSQLFVEFFESKDNNIVSFFQNRRLYKMLREDIVRGYSQDRIENVVSSSPPFIAKVIWGTTFPEVLNKILPSLHASKNIDWFKSKDLTRKGRQMTDYYSLLSNVRQICDAYNVAYNIELSGGDAENKNFNSQEEDNENQSTAILSSRNFTAILSSRNIETMVMNNQIVKNIYETIKEKDGITRMLDSLIHSSSIHSSSIPSTGKLKKKNAIPSKIMENRLVKFLLFDPISPAHVEWSIIERYCEPDLVFFNNINLPGHAGWAYHRLLNEIDKNGRKKWIQIHKGKIHDFDFFEDDKMSESEALNLELQDELGQFTYGTREFAIMLRVQN